MNQLCERCPIRDVCLQAIQDKRCPILSAERGKQILQEEKEVIEQMEMLALKIKEKIKVLIATGQLENARMVFVQLKAIRPNDPELEELEKRISGN